MKNSPKYFDPETLAQIRPLSLRARTLIEGWLAGMHRSPLRGQSLEFSQHREYVPGDDMRQVDWKVFARRLLDGQSAGFISAGKCGSP